MVGRPDHKLKGLYMKHKIKKGIIICLSLLLVLEMYLVWHIRFGIEMKPKAVWFNYSFERTCEIPSNKEIKAKIDKLFNIPYIYIEKDLESDLLGQAIPLFRVVIIDNSITGYEYAGTLAHELVHIRDMTSNECWTEYQAIITLYESDDEFLQEAGKSWMRSVLLGGYFGSDYDCAGQLYEYLQKG